MCENKVLRRIFRPRRDEVTGDWRKLHNEELHNLYSWPKGKPEGKRPLGRRRLRWVDNITMDVREIGCDGMDWIDLD
jgi:hypothetical protein